MAALDHRIGRAQLESIMEAVKLPQLPVHAPQKLRDNTVDIEDPRRVYAVHRAIRAYSFSSLQEE